MTVPDEAGERMPLRRVPVILRSWDGPNSRIGLEVDLTQMPWGPFDALGKRLDLLLPSPKGLPDPGDGSESEIERALRYVEHAADRCGEFAQLGTAHQDLWLRSQHTWEWIRRYLTRLWVEREVEGKESEAGETAETPIPLSGSAVSDASDGASASAVADGSTPSGVASASSAAGTPRLPGAAGTLRIAAQALRAMPLSTWRESMSATDPDGPTREEAIQTLAGIAQLLETGASAPAPRPAPDGFSPTSSEAPPGPSRPESEQEEDEDPDHVSFEFAQGYDEGYQMGRRVGLALGSRKERRPKRP